MRRLLAIGLVAGLATSFAVPADARPANPGYAGVMVTTSPVATDRRVDGACAFAVVPLATTGTGVVVVTGTAVSSGTVRSISTTVVCEVFSPAGSFAVGREEPMAVTTVNGSATVGLAYYTVCVAASAFYADARRVTAPRACRSALL